jgi:hypothetical protein
MLVNIPIDVLYNLRNSLQYFTPKMLGIGFLHFLGVRSLCILKIKALQFIPIDCPDLLP